MKTSASGRRAINNLVQSAQDAANKAHVAVVDQLPDAVKP